MERDCCNERGFSTSTIKSRAFDCYYEYKCRGRVLAPTVPIHARECLRTNSLVGDNHPFIAGSGNKLT
jgi:hypothetical protein